MKRPVWWLKRKCHLIITGGINKNHLEHMNGTQITVMRGVQIIILPLICTKICAIMIFWLSDFNTKMLFEEEIRIIGKFM